VVDKVCKQYVPVVRACVRHLLKKSVAATLVQQMLARVAVAQLLGVQLRPDIL